MKSINFFQFASNPIVYIDGIGEEVFSIGIYDACGEDLTTKIPMNMEKEDVISLDFSKIEKGKYQVMVSGIKHIFHKS